MNMASELCNAVQPEPYPGRLGIMDTLSASPPSGEVMAPRGVNLGKVRRPARGRLSRGRRD